MDDGKASVASLKPSTRKYSLLSSPSSSRPRLPSRTFSSSFSSNQPTGVDAQDPTCDTLTTARTRAASSLEAQHNKSPRARAAYTDVRPKSSSSSLSQTFSPLSTNDLSPAASYFALRSDSSGNELRSPFNRRPPASRSSHGIETSSGPPPALSTQRSCSIENWRALPIEKSAPLPELTPRSLARLNAATVRSQGGVGTAIKGAHNILGEEECIEIHDPDLIPSTNTGSETPKMTTTIASQSRFSGSAASKRFSGTFSASQHARSNSQSSNEDLFFDIANGEDTNQTITDEQSAREHQLPSAAHADATTKSRAGLPTHRHVRSQPNATAQPSQTNGDTIQSSPIGRERRGSLHRQEMSAQVSTPPSTDRMSSIREHTYAASAHPLDSKFRTRLSSGNPKPILTATRGLSTRERSPESPSYIGGARRKSVTDSHGYRFRNHLQYGSNSTYNSSPLTGRHEANPPEPSPPAVREGTESSVSTTAPSTVWDELDDLKSRIKKLELTGRLPPSSGAAMSSVGERPRTATTTVTTMSSSPKRTQTSTISPTLQSVEHEDNHHPLLKSALNKSQAVVGVEVFRSLDSVTSDALALSKMTSENNATQSNATLERQLKRKADSLCRSLTELCIALSEAKPSTEDVPTEHNNSRPVSRDTAHSRRPHSIFVDEPRFQRAASLDPEPSSARVFSRLEARRRSIIGGNSLQASPQLPPNNRTISSDTQTSTTSQLTATEREPSTPTQSTLTRTNTVLQRVRGEDNDSTVRPLSRAMTELNRGSNRNSHGGTSSASQRISREYTSSHPLPRKSGQEEWATRDHASSALPVRRSYFSSNIKSNGVGAAESPTQQQPNGTSQPSTPGTPSTTIAASETMAGRTVKRGYLERRDSGNGAISNEARPTAAEARQKRLSSLGLGNLSGRRG